MKSRALLRKIFPDLSTTLARFPGPAIASLFMCVVANLRVVERSFAGDQFYTDVLWSGAAGFLASGSAHLFAESRGWLKPRNILFALLIGFATAIMFWFHAILGVERQFFTTGLVFLLMTSAYLRQASQSAFWLFNLRLGLAALLAILVSAAACGGIVAILASLEFLFDFKIPYRLYEHVWSTGATLVGPIYGLALTPNLLDEEVDLESYRNSLLERGVSVLLTYVLVPIVLVYAAILYAYAAKIALLWALPKGQVATLVTLFALAGTAAYLISYPWRSHGTALLRLFRSIWFPLTLVPVILLVIGTLRRITDYGITPQRYALMVTAVWLIGLIAYFVFRQRAIDIRHIVGSFAVLALVTSVGPWGARSLSMNDQYGRLERVLTKYGFLTNGRLAETTPPVTTMSETERDTAGSIIYFLVNRGEHERFRPWFEGRATNPWLRKDFRPHFVSEPLIKIVGYRYSGETPSHIRRVSFESSLPSTFSTDQNAIIAGPVKLYRDNRPQLMQTSRVPRVENRGAVLAILHEDHTWLISTSELLDKASDADTQPYPRPPFSITVGDPGNRMTLVVQQVFGEFDKGVAKASSGQFWLILPR
jgi:hypothetical protein